MKRRVITFLLTLVLCLSGCSQQQGQPEHHRDVFAMDTYMVLKVYSENGERLLDEAEQELRMLEGRFSVTRPDSEITAINRSAGKPVKVSEDTAALLTEVLYYAALTDGALDPTVYPLVREWGFTTGSYHVPEQGKLHSLLQKVDYHRLSVQEQTVVLTDGSMIDVGAVAKGYAGEKLAGLLRQKGVTSALLNLGGNVQAIGSKPDGSAWTVGIQDPENPEETSCTLRIRDRAVVTSGNYERFFEDENGCRYWHIIDPADGCPADNGLCSVTVVGESGVACDALSTALFVMGTDRAKEFCRQHPEIEAVLIDTEHRLYYTKGLKDDILLSEHYSGSVI